MSNLEANLVLSTDQFDRAIRSSEAVLDGLIRRTAAGLTLNLDARVAGAESEIEGVVRRFDGETIGVEALADVSRFESEVEGAVDNAESNEATIPIDGDPTAFNSVLDRLDVGGIAESAGEAIGAALNVSFAAALDEGAFERSIGAALQLTEAQAEAAGDAAGLVFQSGLVDNLAEIQPLTADLLRFEIVTEDASPEVLADYIRRVEGVGQTWDIESTLITRSLNQINEAGILREGQDGLDAITSLLAASKVPADELLESLSEYSPFLAEAGASFDDFAAIAISSGASTTIELDKLADSIKEMTVRVDEFSPDQIIELADAARISTAEAENLIAALQSGDPGALGEAVQLVQSIEDPAARAAAQMLIFGTQGEDAFNVLAAADPTTLFQTIEGSASDLADAAGGGLTNAMESLVRTGLAPVVDLLEQFIPVVTSVVASTTEFLASSGLLTPALVAVAVAMGALVIAASPISFTMAGIAAAATAVVVGIGLLESRFGVVSAVLAPAQAAFTALQDGLSRIGALLSGDLSPGLQTGAAAFASFGASLDFGPILDGITAAYQVFVDALSRVDVEAIISNLGTAFGALTTAVAFVLPILRPVAQFFLNELGTAFATVGQIVGGAVDLIAGVLAGDWTQAWTGAQAIVGGVIDGIIQRVTLFPRLLLELLTLAAGQIGPLLGTIFGGLLGIVTGVLESIITAVVNFGASILTAFNDSLFGIPGIVLGIFTTVVTSVLVPLGNILLGIGEWVANVIASFVAFGVQVLAVVSGAFFGIGEAILGALLTVALGITNWLAEQLAAFIAWAAGVIAAIAGGLASLAATVLAPFLEAAAGIIGWVADTLASVGAWGASMIAVLLGGVAALWATVSRPFIEAATGIVAWVAETVGSVRSWGADMIGVISSGIASLWASIRGFFQEVVSGVIRWIIDTVAQARRVGPLVIEAVRSGLSSLASTFIQPFNSATQEVSSWISRISGVLNGAVDTVRSIMGRIQDALNVNISVPSISLPSLPFGLGFTGGINQAGQQTLVEGFWPEAIIPISGPFANLGNQLGILERSGLYDVVASDLARNVQTIERNTITNAAPTTDRSRTSTTINQRIVLPRGSGRRSTRRAARRFMNDIRDL